MTSRMTTLRMMATTGRMTGEDDNDSKGDDSKDNGNDGKDDNNDGGNNNRGVERRGTNKLRLVTLTGSLTSLSNTPL
jgi:hypothetical protein